jgi:putative addiction module killer protein
VIEVHQTAGFASWLVGLRDRTAAVRIATRLARIQAGLMGDFRMLGKVGEIRVDHGPGYRLYFLRRGPQVIILLCGGDKSSQARDIRRAKAIALEVVK